MEYANNQGFDLQQIRQWWNLERLTPEGKGLVTEIRILGDAGKVYSGYFNDVETLINAITPYFNMNVYYTMNVLSDALMARGQGDCISFKPKETTSANDILGRRMVVLDIDPVRSSGVNSTDEELQYAKDMANEIVVFLRNQGFNKPIVAVSSNGVHIKLGCALANTPEVTTLIKNFLAAMSMLFSSDKCLVDTVLYDSNRIIRLQGSMSRKGNSRSKTRPQRASYYVMTPDEIIPNDIEYFRKVAAMLPEPEKPSKFNNFSNDKFDLDAFIERHNIQVREIQQVSDGRKIILDHCLFDSNHKGKDAMLFQRNDGAIGYHCFHNSCSQYKFRDVRLMFEPDAYNKSDYREFIHKRQYYGGIKVQPKAFTPAEETEEKGKKWLSMSDIQYVDISTLKSIPTGFVDLDRKIIGLMLGDVSIITGLSASGKSSWLGVLSLNTKQRGYKSATFSAELQSFRYLSWINQMAAGKSNVRKKEGYDNFYYTPKSISEKVNTWLKDDLLLFNNEYGNDWMQLFSDIRDVVETKGVQLVIIDNLMSLSLDEYSGDQNTQQTRFINDIKTYAKKQNIHVILCAHPRKSNDFLRKESVSGTSNLTNLCDNLFILHRVGKDFSTRATDFFGADVVSHYLHYSVVLEIAKNRSQGVVDHLVGMFYEQETRRLKNEISEYIHYGWEDADTIQSTLDLPSQSFESAESDFLSNFEDESEAPF